MRNNVSMFPSDESEDMEGKSMEFGLRSGSDYEQEAAMDENVRAQS